jgi:hypothetical protein
MTASSCCSSNGDHNTWWIKRHHPVLEARTAWLDHYVRGLDNGADTDDRVRIFLETHRGPRAGCGQQRRGVRR